MSYFRTIKITTLSYLKIFFYKTIIKISLFFILYHINSPHYFFSFFSFRHSSLSHNQRTKKVKTHKISIHINSYVKSNRSNFYGTRGVLFTWKQLYVFDIEVSSTKMQSTKDFAKKPILRKPDKRLIGPQHIS